jgi:hypothetical protein
MSGESALGATLAGGLVLILLGVGQVMLAIVAFHGDEQVLQRAKYSFDLSLTSWGWLHVVIGVLAILIGVGVLMGKTWAYLAGLVIAFLSALGNFAFLPQAPIWSALLIAFAVFVMWGLVAELNEER